MKRKMITRDNLKSGIKRVNLSMRISDYKNLVELTGVMKVNSPGTAALIMLTKTIDAVKKTGEQIWKKKGINFSEQDRRVVISLLQRHKSDIDKTMHLDEGMKIHSIMYIDSIIEKVEKN